MKKIIVHNCTDCPYAEFDVSGRKPNIKIYYKCDHPNVEEDGDWTEGEVIPRYCPLEDDN